MSELSDLEVKILQFLDSKASSSEDVSKELKIPIYEVDHLMNQLEEGGYVKGVKSFNVVDGEASQRFVVAHLTSKGKTALSNPGLIRNSQSSTLNQTTINAQYLAAANTGSGSIQDVTQNIGTNLNDLRDSSIGNFANQVNDNAWQQSNQYNYSLEPQQTLAEAATEIQRLLKQLERTNPSATEFDQVAYVSIAAKPDLKQRAIAALKEGGETAIEEFFLENKYLKVCKAVIKGWLQPNG